MPPDENQGLDVVRTVIAILLTVINFQQFRISRPDPASPHEFTFKPVNNSVILINLLSQMHVTIFWYDSASPWKSRYGFDDSHYSLCKKRGIIFGVFSDIFADILKV